MPIANTFSPDDRVERYELREPPAYQFSASRRECVQVLGAGLVIAISARALHAQQGRRNGRGGFRSDPADEKLSARFHIDHNGIVTVMTGKVEVGQGSRTQLSQAAAEELRLPLEKIRLL